MCWETMAKNGMIQNQERVQMRKLLAVAVRSVQWSYAIFWSPSTHQNQEGVLEWGEGYYNGDIKTMKTIEAKEHKADKMELQRSEQLCELYESLLEGEASIDQQPNRPCASLSPEDLTDAEWYYLVCMSFVFSPGQDLPGRALGKGQSIWLCNAHSADTKVFSRSLLAKSASIQTVLCFPHLGGVIELGVTELVLEDPTLIQHIKTSILEFSKPNCSNKYSSSTHKADGDMDHMCNEVDNNAVALKKISNTTEDIKFEQKGLDELDREVHKDFLLGSPEECSNGCKHHHQVDSQVQSWDFMDAGISNRLAGSMDSSDCISQVLANQRKTDFPTKGGNVNSNLLSKELQDCDHRKLSSLDLGNDQDEDLHYKRTVSMLLRNSHRLNKNTWIRGCDRESIFVSWKKGKVVSVHRPEEGQRMLKRVLINVPLMHNGCSLRARKERSGEDIVQKPETDEICLEYVLPEKRKEDGKFVLLRSMVPSINKIDKVSVLGDTIKYLKELEARVEELESCTGLAEHVAKVRTEYPEIKEQGSESYGIRRIDYGKRPRTNKRKACGIDETDLELKSVVVKEVPKLDMEVSIKEKEVVIEMRCTWREYLLLDIMDAVNNLNLDAHSVQSSTNDGVLSLSLRSKFRGAKVASPKMIKQALARIAGKC